MRSIWFKNPENIVCADLGKFAEVIGMKTGIADFYQEIEHFSKNPTRNGKSIIANDNTPLLLFVPNLMFDEKLNMGDRVWVYFNETHECCCLH